MKTLTALLAAAALIFMGCDNAFVHPDTTAPRAPRGLATATGDDFIELFWDSNPENDVAGYNVFVSGSYDGRYELIGSTENNSFVDNDARNGQMYYYAVTAYDFEGNESDLSKDVAYDVPRPEGYGVQLADYRRNPDAAGYDFSDYCVVPFDDTYADMYFENYNGTLYMNVNTDTDILDAGLTASVLDIKTAPASGWSTTHDAQLIAGHTYIVWTWDDHYAKFRVASLSGGRVVFDWAYQLQEKNPMLKRAPGSRGAASRPPLVLNKAR